MRGFAVYQARALSRECMERCRIFLVFGRGLDLHRIFNTKYSALGTELESVAKTGPKSLALTVALLRLKQQVPAYPWAHSYFHTPTLETSTGASMIRLKRNNQVGIHP